MELKDFISKTLQDIADGIKEGNQYMQNERKASISSQNFRVNFDVNVAYDDTTSTGSSGKLAVASFLNVGANKDVKQTNSNYNRIQFSVVVDIHTHSRY